MPAELRERMHVGAGSPLMFIETPRGVLLATRDRVREMVRESLQGNDLVAELLADRRRAAAAGNDP